MDSFDVMLTLIGLALAVWMPIETTKQRRAKARRTGRVSGTVVGSELHRIYSHVGDMGFSPGTHHAMVEYEVKGQSYSCVADHGVSWKRPRAGSRVEVAYDPANPADGAVFVESLATLEQVVYIVVPLLGAGLLVVQAVRFL